MAFFEDFLQRLRGVNDPDPVANAVRQPLTGQQIVDLVEGFEQSLLGQVPGCVSARVRTICATVVQTVPRLDRLGAGSPQAHSVVTTASSYLPEAVEGYLRLPRQWADTRDLGEGQTALMVLVDQLDLLDLTLDRILDAVCRTDAAALLAHGAFLAEKFGHAGAFDGELAAPVSAGPAPAQAPAPAPAGPSNPAGPSPLAAPSEGPA